VPPNKPFLSVWKLPSGSTEEKPIISGMPNIFLVFLYYNLTEKNAKGGSNK
jgi:hypothetical protein